MKSNFLLFTLLSGCPAINAQTGHIGFCTSTITTKLDVNGGFISREVQQ